MYDLLQDLLDPACIFLILGYNLKMRISLLYLVLLSAIATSLLPNRVSVLHEATALETEQNEGVEGITNTECSADTQDDLVQEETEIEMRPLPKLILHWSMAAGRDERIRLTSWGVWRTGWHGFINKLVADHLVGNKHAILLHNPFGKTKFEGDMEFRQWQNAQGTPLVKNFVDAWKPIAEEREVIGYVGSLRGDKELRAGLDAGEQWAIDAAFEAVRPLIEAGMSIALDAMIEAPEDEGMWIHFIKPLIEQQAKRGLRVYIEPRPLVQATNLHDLPIIAIASTWESQSKSKALAPNEKLTGPKILLAVHSGYQDTVVGMNQFIADVRAMGDDYIPAIPGGLYSHQQHGVEWPKEDKQPSKGDRP